MTPRRLGPILVLLTGLLGVGLLLADPAAAHATVVTSNPADGSRLKAAPHTVTVTFDESVGLGSVGYLHVTDQTGRRVDAHTAYHPAGDMTKVADDLLGSLVDSSYTASFRVISADSHPVVGTIRFVVGNGALVRGSVEGRTVNTATSAAFDVTRWVSYAGFALLAGAWLMLTIWPAGRGDRRARLLCWAGWAATAVGAVAEVLLQGAYASGAGLGKTADTALLDATLHTDYGRLHCARLVLLGLVALLFARSLRLAARPARWELAGGLFAFGIAWTFAAGGHSATTSPAALSVPADMLHLLAMAAWIGGLVMLLGALLPRRDPGELPAVLPVFSTVAFVSVVLLAITGSYAAWRGIGTVHAAFSTSYGLLVMAKIVLFAGLLAFGNWSRLMVRRRFSRPTLAYAMTDAALAQIDEKVHNTAANDRDPVETERLRRSVFVEALLGLVVLGLSAVLVAEPRGREALAASYREPISATASLGHERTVTVTADSGTRGNVGLFVVLSPGTRPIKIVLTATQHRAQIGPIPVRLRAAGPDSYTGSARFPVGGEWAIDLVVTTSRFDATSTDVTLRLH